VRLALGQAFSAGIALKRLLRTDDVHRYVDFPMVQEPQLIHVEPYKRHCVY